MAIPKRFLLPADQSADKFWIKEKRNSELVYEVYIGLVSIIIVSTVKCRVLLFHSEVHR